MSQEDVAFAARIAVATFQKIEYAQTATSWESVCRVAEALNMSMAELGAAVDAERQATTKDRSLTAPADAA